MSSYCNNGERQRVKVTQEQADEGKAPCPLCGRVLGIVPSRAKMEATLAPHLPPAPPQPRTARPPGQPRSSAHRAPGGGWCSQNQRRPVLNGAGERIGEQCIGCDAPFALPGRCGRPGAAA